MSRDKFAQLCGVNAATVANWELGRNAPKGPTLQRVQDVVAGRIGSSHLTAAEELLLDRILKEGKFASREEFFAHALVELIKKQAQS